MFFFLLSPLSCFLHWKVWPRMTFPFPRLRHELVEAIVTTWRKQLNLRSGELLRVSSWSLIRGLSRLAWKEDCFKARGARRSECSSFVSLPIVSMSLALDFSSRFRPARDNFLITGDEKKRELKNWTFDRLVSGQAALRGRGPSSRRLSSVKVRCRACSYPQQPRFNLEVPAHSADLPWQSRLLPKPLCSLYI